MFCSAVDHFKKQFAYLEEHYGNGVAVPPPERQHASLPRYPTSMSFAIFLNFLYIVIPCIFHLLPLLWDTFILSCVCRPCVLYSDNSVQNSVEVADDLSKCSIKETEKSHMERSCGIPMTRLPLQVPQSIQGLNSSMSFCNNNFVLFCLHDKASPIFHFSYTHAT